MTLRAYSADQVRAAEAPHLAAGVPLMERAATALAAEIQALCPTDAARVLLLVGSGDNGGDTLFAGALLATAGVTVDIVGTGSRMHPAGLTAALDAGATVRDAAEVGGLAASADVVVDGVLGIGVTGSPALRGRARDIVVDVLSSLERDEPARIIAVDLPSGVGPDDGAVPDVAILRADVTVTFGAAKAGLLFEPGASFAGEVRVVDIGLGADYAAMTPVVEVAAPAARAPAPINRVEPSGVAPVTARPTRTRASRLAGRVAEIVCAVAITVLVGAIVYLFANDASIAENGAIVDDMFRDVGPGFTTRSIDTAWSIVAVASAVTAFAGWAGMFARRWTGGWQMPLLVLGFGIALAAVVFLGGTFLAIGLLPILAPVPLATLALAVVWATTLPALRGSGPASGSAEAAAIARHHTERRMQRRIDIALGVASLVVFVGPVVVVIAGSLVSSLGGG